MIDPRVFKALDRAKDEVDRYGRDGLQFAMVDVGRALGAMDIDNDHVFTFVEEDFYQMAAALLMTDDRAVTHFQEYLEKGINQLKYGRSDGPLVQRPKTQWEKTRDGELILPGDPK